MPTRSIVGDSILPEFECEHCGKRFRWKPELAGKRVRCTCGSIMTCPTQPPQLDELYDLQPQAPSAVSSSPKQVKAPLPYRALKENAPAKADPETIKNFYMPLWLLVGGIVIELIAALLGQDLKIAMARIGIDVVLGTALMLIGIMVAARFRQIDLGAFWIAVFKLSAISVAPAAVVLLITPILYILPTLPLGVISLPFGALLGLGVEFVLYFALLGALFDLDESDTWYCVWVIFLVRVAVYFLWNALV